MRRAIITSTLLALLLAISGASPLSAQAILDESTDQAIHDEGGLIHLSGVLLDHAGKTLDLENEDAVILFQRIETRWTVDGRLGETTKRSVLIRTEYGLNHFADLRIPWDSARQILTVERLRTLRLSDESVIDAGPTAVVETLPYAVDRAPDYCHLRETMLLHDGVELPCILETIWTVEDTEPFRPGASGTHSFMGPEPALVSQFEISFPAGQQPVIDSAGGAPQPTRSTDTSTGLESLTFEMRELAAHPHPVTDESILLQPRVNWSTWKDWPSLALDLEARVANGAVIDDDLRTALDEKLKDVRTAAEKSRLVAEFIDQTTRLIDLPGRWWPEPRRASRTWATGYGHQVDRAVLAAALYGEAGFSARLAFRSTGYGETEVSVPGFDWNEGVSLQVSGDGVDGWFDPDFATLTAGNAGLAGRTVWIPGEGSKPVHQPADQPDRMAVRFDLAFDAEKQAWTGTGVLEARGTISPLHQMSGLGTEALDYLNGLSGAILGRAKVTACNPERFDSSGVIMGFALEVPAGDRDPRGRLILELAPFPADHFVALHQNARGSDVYLPASVEMQYELRLEPGDLETAYLPAATLTENGTGLLQVETSREEKTEDEEGKVVLVRRLQLTSRHYTATQWPDMRALLLAGENRAGRVLYFK